MRKMLRVKRVSVVLGILFVTSLALVGALSITRGTPVKAVVNVGDKSGPPKLSDSLFTQSIELYTGLHLTRGNAARQMLNGDGTGGATSTAISFTAGIPHVSSGSTAGTWAFGVITYCFRCRHCSYLTRCAAYSISAQINCSPASSVRTGSLSGVIFDLSSTVC